MERRENSKFIAIVHDPAGSYAYLGGAGRTRTLERIEGLKKQGIKESSISVYPVLEPKKTVLPVIIISSIIGIAAYLARKKKKRAEKPTADTI
jgi:hypothetical protein